MLEITKSVKFPNIKVTVENLIIEVREKKRMHNLILYQMTVTDSLLLFCCCCLFFSQTFDAYDRHGYGFWIYYYSLVIIGSFFMLNLVLGVLSG